MSIERCHPNQFPKSTAENEKKNIQWDILTLYCLFSLQVRITELEIFIIRVKGHQTFLKNILREDVCIKFLTK